MILSSPCWEEFARSWSWDPLNGFCCCLCRFFNHAWLQIHLPGPVQDFAHLLQLSSFFLHLKVGKSYKEVYETQSSPLQPQLHQVRGILLTSLDVIDEGPVMRVVRVDSLGKQYRSALCAYWYGLKSQMGDGWGEFSLLYLVSIFHTERPFFITT